MIILICFSLKKNSNLWLIRVLSVEVTSNLSLPDSTCFARNSLQMTMINLITFPVLDTPPFLHCTRVQKSGRCNFRCFCVFHTSADSLQKLLSILPFFVPLQTIKTSIFHYEWKENCLFHSRRREMQTRTHKQSAA